MNGNIKDAKKLLDLLNTQILVEPEKVQKPLTETEFNKKWDELATNLNNAFKSLKSDTIQDKGEPTNDNKQ